MRRPLLAMAALVAFASAPACDPSEVQMRQREPALVRRAAFDLRCEQDELRVVHINYTTRGISGCGRQATYVYVDKQGWIMDSRSESQDSN